ncbi:hypothetical protein MINS_19700 [Mycolicibacterium insubricum]|jgi:hypothetical protein|uniref:Uncharacterized protein n=1 Tax=Mycolicibacterium insubricum TaxID=444597 RepID=A0A1X0DKB9_9MYCO|nr:hypothetical protein [Mycolicibacterium insubricum]MCB9440030.1 hypothetical protein [Mycolicibacterium sp.]MCV7081744.1 hypothetical protein [Mycolicibacterium insubricum]ORA72853.1 hypothetical protein BST26_04455 [Mycolicibacterium insubricum]BBZ66541.1 hypothetical protein MINS_19700 [Mycolicibacterium insubricum]
MPRTNRFDRAGRNAQLEREIEMNAGVSNSWQRAIAATVVLASATLGSSILGTGVASATDTTVEKTYSMTALDTIPVVIVCPPEAKYLTRGHLAPGRIVPDGIEVIEDGGIGVNMNSHYGAREEGRARSGATIIVEPINGGEGTATNWNTFGRKVKLIAHCTSDKNKSWLDDGS